REAQDQGRHGPRHPHAEHVQAALTGDVSRPPKRPAEPAECDPRARFSSPFQTAWQATLSHAVWPLMWVMHPPPSGDWCVPKNRVDVVLKCYSLGSPRLSSRQEVLPAMTDKDQERIVRLEANRAALVRLASQFQEEAGLNKSIMETMGGVLTRDYEDTDFAQVMSDREVNDRLVQLLSENREQVERALSPLPEGKYGQREDRARPRPT